MPIYEYNCPFDHSFEVQRSMRDDNLQIYNCPSHGVVCDQQPPLVRTIFTPTIGRDSGVYALDYGKRATEDLTVPGKFERLRQAGTIADPFKEHADDTNCGRIAPYEDGINDL